MSEQGENNKENTETPAKTNDLGDGITRADYDQAKHRARLFEGKLVDMEKKLEALGGLDAIQEKIIELDAVKRKSVKTPEDLEEWQSQKEQEIRQSIQAEINQLKEQAQTAASQLHQVQVVDKVTDTWNGKFVKSAMPLIKEQYIKKYVDKDEEGYFIKDDKGEVRYNGALRMSLEDYFNEIAGLHPDLLEGQRASGNQLSGNNKPSTSTGGNKAPNVSGLTKEQMVEAFSKAGRASTWAN